ncbi:MAG: hypothetical protein UV26_C0030G0013 [candidate division WWE3 bacterium GW2011_GWF2_42_42]|uniref:Uncharacterized protein n=1 Tax=candidate division WWE3 bacterium GW2011_GWF2_42_42 TaxID=1619142 RepID=A0A0G1CKF9_UNCKA|nr:MAG: hypothetical protein UV26_C0030G0013 [candidate division WWE3 bacterium GW2011_GWF2_42_42]
MKKLTLEKVLLQKEYIALAERPRTFISYSTAPDRVGEKLYTLLYRIDRLNEKIKEGIRI